MQLHGRRQRHGVLCQAVIEKRLAALDAMCHFAAITEDGEETVCETCFRPDVEGGVEGMPFLRHERAGAAVEGGDGCEALVARAEFLGDPGCEESVAEGGGLREAEEGSVVYLGTHRSGC